MKNILKSYRKTKKSLLNVQNKFVLLKHFVQPSKWIHLYSLSHFLFQSFLFYFLPCSTIEQEKIGKMAKTEASLFSPFTSYSSYISLFITPARNEIIKGSVTSWDYMKDISLEGGTVTLAGRILFLQQSLLQLTNFVTIIFFCSNKKNANYIANADQRGSCGG